MSGRWRRRRSRRASLRRRVFYDGQVQALHTVALVGEVLSWIGLGVGIPALVLGGMIRLVDGHWERVDIAILHRADDRIARWFAAGDFHERPLRHRERTHADWHRGWVSTSDPTRVRLEPAVLPRLLLTIGGVFAGVGAAGFIVSLLPAFV